ncbi:MAG: N-acetyltransferase [bacterium]|nr:N-acetyltransferase [bacterium]MDT8395863.1 N-acetyltransferase [bacterium]
MDKADWTLRKARMDDIPRIHSLVNEFASQGEMLGRSRSELYEGLRDFFVVEEDGIVLGCSALHINWEDLAEVRSLAVVPELQGKGLGKVLVKACVDEARDLGVARVYALTYRPEFFEKLGFKRVDKDSLPHKVWGDCLKCPQFPNCDEDAVLMEVI